MRGPAHKQSEWCRACYLEAVKLDFYCSLNFLIRYPNGGVSELGSVTVDAGHENKNK